MARIFCRMPTAVFAVSTQLSSHFTGVKRRHIRRRRRNRRPEQSIQHPRAAQHRAGLAVVRSDRHHRAQIHDAGAPVVGPLHQLRLVAVNVLELVFQLVELHQPLGHVGVVAVQQFQQAAVFAQDALEDQDRFGAQIGRHRRRVEGLQLRQHRRRPCRPDPACPATAR